jgi:hypothetical protein
MSRLYIPVAVTVVLIASLTMWESVYSDRFTGTSIDVAEFNQRFARLPKDPKMAPELGAWVGVDNPVTEETLNTAGAVSHVSRTYTNQQTGDKVDVWLVVGHARDISRHTPDICYPSQGFAMDGTQLKQTIMPDGSTEEANFHTARFKKESALGTGGPLVRVFWAWNPHEGDENQWVAPDSSRIAFGNNRALYKLYFTSPMKDRDESVTDNMAYKFAKMMLPVVNKTLFADGATPFDASQAPTDAVPAEAAPAAAAPAETAPAEAAAPAA